ncbi:MAG TPA: hypothetical protein VFY87_26395 [Geminicoccaceae bacterium]|nr:hypothetical protein [Geminicoccaceae bacterium]
MRRKARAAQEKRELEAARRLYREELPGELKRRLTVELARTRGSELQRAYRGLLAVAAGFRLKRAEGNGPASVQPEPCVVLTVAAKRKRGRLTRRQRLPTELLCHVEHDGVRRLCAVSIDVDERAALGGAMPQLGVEVVPPLGMRPNPGSVACVIQRRNDLNDSWLISARHVLGHGGWLAPVAPDTKLRERGGNTPFAEASSFFRGAMGDAFVPSCDVQLAVVTDSDAARAALGGIAFADYLLEHEENDIPERLFVLTAHGAVPVRFQQVLRGAETALDYGAAGAGKVTHESLIVAVLDPGAATEDGDSGSALATAPDGGRLVGMHIASNRHQGGNRVFAIPAWELLTPENYNPSAFNDEWVLLAPDELPAVEPPRFNDIADFLGRVAAAFPVPLPQAGLRASQEEGFKALLDWWRQNGTGDVAQLAYVLATAWHETGTRMQPVREGFGRDEAETLRLLDHAFRRGRIKSRYFDPQPPSGLCYYGRGFAQLTHASNYETLGRRLNRYPDLLNNPDLALRMDFAVPILFVGMLEGLFTGEKLGKHVKGPASHSAFVKARKVVNGQDRAEMIAKYADRFLACLT